jgi:uncharacterized membrane protein YcaP (DUF421 family)
MLIPLIRTLILYALIVVAMRFMGKRQVGEMQPTELVVTILVSAVASVPMQDISIPLSHGAVPILTLIAAEVIISALSLKLPRLRRVMTGSPIPVITGGVIDARALKTLRITLDDLLEDLRVAGVFNPQQVYYAQMETNGKLSLLLRAGDAPATAKDAGVKASQDEPFRLIIADGRVNRRAMVDLGKDSAWLEDVLRNHGAAGPESVFMLGASAHGGVIFLAKEGA